MQIFKDRRPVDPPPILRLEVATDQDPDGVYKQSKLMQHMNPTGHLEPNSYQARILLSLHILSMVRAKIMAPMRCRQRT